MVQLSTPGVTPNRGMGPPWGTFCQITLTSCSISISLRLSHWVLNSDRDQRSARNWSHFFAWSRRIAEQLADTKLQTERSLYQKLINSLVDFACTRSVDQLEIISSDERKSFIFFANSKVNKETHWRQQVTSEFALQRLVNLNYGLRRNLGSQIKLWTQRKTNPKSEMTRCPSVIL